MSEKVRRPTTTMSRNLTDTTLKLSQHLLMCSIALVLITGVLTFYFSIWRTTAHASGAPVPETMTAQVLMANVDAAPKATIVATDHDEIALALQLPGAERDCVFLVTVALPEGYHLNDKAPQHYEATITTGAEHLAFASGEQSVSITSKTLKLPLRLPLQGLS